MTPVQKTLIAVNVAVLILEYLFSSLVIAGIPAKILFMQYFALIPFDGFVAPAGSNLYGFITPTNMEFIFYPWQLITYQFMHGGFTHLFFNMFGIWMFSAELEEKWGSAKFLAYYLLAGIGAGILHMFISVSLGSIAPTIGASGSLYGIIIGFAMLNPDRKIMMFPLFIPIPARIFGIGMMVISVIMGVSSSDGIAHFAHFGGALTGLILVKFGERLPFFHLARRYFRFGIPSNEQFTNTDNMQNRFGGFNSEKGYSQFTSQSSYTTTSTSQEVKTDSKPKQFNLNNFDLGGTKVTQATVDAILDKISKTGYHSLTEQEKYILTEISKRL
jgi:membrane associated rhomboid family serine protease